MMADAQNPQPLPKGDLYEAMKAFIGFAGLPALPPEHILQGWQNRMALPAWVNDYAVISILSARQRGTPAEIFEPGAIGPSQAGGLDPNSRQSSGSAADSRAGTTSAGPGPGLSPGPGVSLVVGLLEVSVQVDFCAEDDTARQRAERLAVAARSSLGVDFLNQYGFSPLYADDPRDISFVGDARQFVRRWMLTVHLCGTQGAGLTVDVSWFDRAAIARIENVDVHHQARGLDRGRRA